jgi:hypothetical protein
MKAINRRLLKLENRYVPRKVGEPSIAAVIRERRRLRYEREGRPFVETPPEVLRCIPDGLAIGERIRWHRFHHRAAEEALRSQREAEVRGGR